MVDFISARGIGREVRETMSVQGIDMHSFAPLAGEEPWQGPHSRSWLRFHLVWLLLLFLSEVKVLL